MRVLIIGGTGFIGSRVARHLLAGGHTVTVFHRGDTPAPTRVAEVLGTEAHLGAHAADFARLSPDVVVNMILGTEGQARRFVEVFRGVAARAVVISSMDVYRAYDRYRRKEPGAPDPVPLSEGAPLRGTRYPYRTADQPDDYDKVLVEDAVRAAPSLPCTVLRLPMVYGPGDPLHRFNGFIKRMHDRRRTIVLDDGRAGWRGSYGYVEDVAAAITLATTDPRAAGRTYNVGEREAIATRSWAERLASVVGWAGGVVTVPRNLLPPSLLADRDYAQDWVVDTSRIRTELGYREGCTVEQALRATVAWEREHPPLAGIPVDEYGAEDAVLRVLNV